ncbi:Cys-tRNA(Pro) deacylase [Aureimonas sp. Leaf324]|jgi:Cys-tRNA(Pro)/Cys-tRNA(Cys) deacylase|uniref:Cys-tRNA(Pro) deacylase n=1 Tax=Aureimonas sp. Leaf324 TaxID=1736336 RepID=UPI00070035F2|nr:Cys-tRNA(Pro) deacylase [Aureimonas sp. Leaf324]KQQ89435.1 cys-tRNA(pro)/cys-tRNA(cys) deacylase [Aureimonas sp. Leaf324]
MSSSTRATQALKAAGASFTTREYAYDPKAQHIGLQAADALGVPPERLLKTLMATVDGKPVCVVVPSDREVSMKRLAAAMAGKAAQMMPPGDAERMTGYVVGGISPFGQKRRVPVVIEEQSLRHDRVFVNGGRRGLQIELAPAMLGDLLGAVAAPLVAERSGGS